ncbi:hypothetical protein ACHAXA_005152 [Cyclostephanos tholiformis]|uniref:Uncharacterized protein n=1 Tax=Cyclostephanos tholiformis TaxID=382380 RepID=A0ABD3R8K5_9STRA
MATNAAAPSTVQPPPMPPSRRRPSGGNGGIIGGGGGDDDDDGGGERPPRRRDRHQRAVVVERRQHRGHPHQRADVQLRRRQRQSVSVTVEDFRDVFHSKICRASRYKVHAPDCDCAKVAGLRSRYAACRRDGASTTSGMDVVSSTSTDVRVDDGNGDVDARCDAFDRLNLNATTTTTKTKETTTRALMKEAREDDNNEAVVDAIFDNLIVLPDTKANNPNHAYACLGTDRRSFDENWIGCERKLANEIFGIDVGGGNDDDIPTFKVSCAQCLLSDHQPNGFVAIISPSSAGLTPILRCARDASSYYASRRRSSSSGNSPLHADHAHFLCAVGLSSLVSLLVGVRMHHEKRRIAMDIARGMMEDDDCARALPRVMLERMMRARYDSRCRPSSPPNIRDDDFVVRIELGHHLKSLLRILAVECPPPPGDGDEGQRRRSTKVPRDDAMMRCIMAMAYVDDGNDLLTLDLPGGKRHLGESTLMCAIRETMEECSLTIDRGWLSRMVPVRYGGDVLVEVGEEEEEEGEVKGATTTNDGDDERRRNNSDDDHTSDFAKKRSMSQEPAE